MVFEEGDKVRVNDCIYGNPVHIEKIGRVSRLNEEGQIVVVMDGDNNGVCVTNKAELVNAPEQEPKKSMSSLSKISSKVLDKDTRALVEAGVLSASLTVADSNSILEFIVIKYTKELAIEARKKIEEDKKDC